MLYVLLFFLLLFLCICFFILVCPCRYFIEGNRRQKFRGIVILKIGFLKIYLKKVEQEDVYLEYYLGKRKIFVSQRQEQVRGIKNKKSIFTYIRSLSSLDRKGLKMIFKLCRRILQKIRPQESFLQGRIGFMDPYYTGLLAAVLSVFPRENIKIVPDFSKPVCEFSFHLKGEFILGRFFYDLLWILVRRPFRLLFGEKN